MRRILLPILVIGILLLSACGAPSVEAPPAEQPASLPAAFTASDLSITPTEVDVGGEVTISVLITNTGDVEGTCEVTLKIDNVVEATKVIALAGGASQEVTFTTARNTAGEYLVDVNGLSGKFEVKIPPLPAAFTTSDLSITPTEADIGETVTISVLVTNAGEEEGGYTITLKINGVVEEAREITLAGGATERVTFTTSRDKAGTYSVDVNGLTSSCRVKEAPEPKVIKEWTGTGIKTTEPFTISESPWVIVWGHKPEVYEGMSMGLLQIFVYNTKNPDIPVGLAANSMEEESDTSYMYQTGTFYLMINAANTRWAVEILAIQ